MPAVTPTNSRADLEPLIDAWNELFASIRRAKGRSSQQHDGPTLSQFGLLKALATDGDMRIGELATAASIAAPTASRMIDSLESEGLVSRRRSERDRRAIAITLTGSGRRMYERKRDEIEGKRDEMFASMSAIEREHGVRLLHRMAGLMDEL